MSEESSALRTFAEESRPQLESIHRVRARLHSSLDEPPVPSLLRPLGMGLAVGAAVTALALALIHVEPPARLDRELVADAAPATDSSVEGLDLTFEGHGILVGRPAAPELVWQAGTVHVVVDPAQALDVQVRTGEARIRVVGTTFEVQRNARGTRVSVEKGRVSVTCSRGEEGELEAGGKTFCLPATAAGMLARARALQDGAAPVTEVLTAVADGLERKGLTGAVREELLVVEIETLRDSGRREEALVKARELQARATHRKEEVGQLVRDLEPRSAPQ